MAHLDPQTLQAAATEAARLGGSELMARFALSRQVAFKGGIDLVTDADQAAEERIVSFVKSRFPDHSILAEERGGQAGSSAFRWIIDPLDGTTNYAHRVPHFCVSIAVEDEKGLAGAAVYDPVRNEMFSAGRGLGASLNGQPIRVSGESTLGRALLSTGFPYNVWSKPERPLRLFDRFLRVAQGVRRQGSAALDLSYVAAGRYDGFFEVSLKPWDIAAGTLLVREAGGMVANLGGGPLDFATGDVLAANSLLFQEIDSISQEVLASIP